ncbi:uncharacterized protein PpBr36_10523 [Pyricularia pennisetigena]|uniref:uncharacterized protein n=1 Tax=Pyricularia pennisetigena TaxID=1578925 RepID=UPI00114F777F|nr:uncharacterized protein PpBr36_10523 [Pyricularia pennisetigena]TLS21225.1 hypothetical protein PpBr36_10523 [Pyricularia pennisetigena]
MTIKQPPTSHHISLTNPTSTTLSIDSLKFAILARVFSRIHKKVLSTVALNQPVSARTLIWPLPTTYMTLAAYARSTLSSSATMRTFLSAAPAIAAETAPGPRAAAAAAVVVSSGGRLLRFLMAFSSSTEAPSASGPASRRASPVAAATASTAAPVATAHSALSPAPRSTPPAATNARTCS